MSNEINEDMKIGWNACRRQVYYLAEHIQDRKPINETFTDFERGERYMAKGFAKALNAFEAEDCDFLKEAALTAAPASAEREKAKRAFLAGWMQYDTASDVDTQRAHTEFDTWWPEVTP